MNRTFRPWAVCYDDVSILGGILVPNTTKSSQTAIVTALLLLLALPQMGKAYVDPGSGAMIWQVAAAAVIGGLFYLRKFFSRIKDFFTGSVKQSEHASE
jgi:hypothetical protein